MARRDKVADRLSMLKDIVDSSNNSRQQDLFGNEIIDLDSETPSPELTNTAKDNFQPVQHSEQTEKLSPLQRLAGSSSFESKSEQASERDGSSESRKETIPSEADNPFVIVDIPAPEKVEPSKQEIKLQQQLQAQKLQAEIQEQKRLQQEAKLRERDEQRQLQAQKKLEQKQEQEKKRQEQLQIQEHKKQEKKELREKQKLEHLANLEKSKEENRILLEAKAEQKALLLEEKRILQEQKEIDQLRLLEERKKAKEKKKALRQKKREENPPGEKIKAVFSKIGQTFIRLGKSFADFIRNFQLFETGSAPYRFLEKCKAGLKKFFSSVASFFAFVFKKKTLKILIPSLIILILAVNRLPSLIYNLVAEDDELTVFATVNEEFAGSVDETLAAYPNEDFDNDNIYNGLDDHPFDKDADRNGVIDSDTSSTFKCDSAVKLGDLTFIPKNSQCGVTDMHGFYVINGYEDNWLKIDNFSSFYPYIYANDRWEPAEYEVSSGSLLVYIPSDYCYLRLLPERSEYTSTLYLFNSEFSIDYETIGGRVIDGILTVFYPYRSDCPYDIGCRERKLPGIEAVSGDVMAAPTVTKVNTSNLSRFRQMPMNDKDLRQIYLSVSNNSTRVLSVQSDEGESLLIVYGFDYMGNLYVADYNDTTKRGKLDIKPYAQLISDAEGNITVSYTIEIKGMGADSEDSKIVLIK